MPIIEVSGVTKSFGDVQALRGVDLTIEEGTVYGLLGPNGAGKTTAVRVLATLLVPDSGTATVAGLDVCRDAAAFMEAASTEFDGAYEAAANAISRALYRSGTGSIGVAGPLPVLWGSPQR